MRASPTALAREDLRLESPDGRRPAPHAACSRSTGQQAICRIEPGGVEEDGAVVAMLDLSGNPNISPAPVDETGCGDVCP